MIIDFIFEYANSKRGDVFNKGSLAGPRGLLALDFDVVEHGNV